jgi:hypothetical protein
MAAALLLDPRFAECPLVVSLTPKQYRSLTRLLSFWARYEMAANAHTVSRRVLRGWRCDATLERKLLDAGWLTGDEPNGYRVTPPNDLVRFAPAAPSGPRSDGWTYLIQAGDHGPVKIGHTRSGVEQRLAALQTATHEPLHLRLELAGTHHEKTLHERFAHLRRAGEWFDPAVLDLIAEGY